MFYSLKNKRKLDFDSLNDKKDLIAILKERAKQLKNSAEFTSSILKNTAIQRSFINIEKLIQELENVKTTVTSDTKTAVKEPCFNSTERISDDHLFQIFLEIAWYLVHPDKLPSEIQCEWLNLIKKMDTLRLGDIIEDIRQTNERNISNVRTNAFNYFKKINIGEIAKADTLKNALDKAKRVALDIQGDNSNKEIKTRLKSLLNILEMKKYLSNDLRLDEDRMKIIDASASSNIQRTMPSNPMKGGTTNALGKPLRTAMMPIYDYFKVVYDPIYSFLDTSLSNYINHNTTNKRISLPQLTTILHICNNLSGEGIYRVTNVDGEILQFIRTLLSDTDMYLSKLQENKDKNTFNRQLFKLPRVRLTSLMNKFLNSSSYKNPDDIIYIQFFIVGGNARLLDESEFKSDDVLFEAINDFFRNSDLFIHCTKSDNVSENINMNATYEIDYNTIDVGNNLIKIDNLPNNYFNKHKDDKLYLDELLSISPYIVCNDAEIALCIFILSKYLLPV